MVARPSIKDINPFVFHHHHTSIWIDNNLARTSFGHHTNICTVYEVEPLTQAFMLQVGPESDSRNMHGSSLERKPHVI